MKLFFGPEVVYGTFCLLSIITLVSTCQGAFLSIFT